MRYVAGVSVIIISFILIFSLRLSKQVNSKLSNAVDDLLIAVLSVVLADATIIFFNDAIISNLAYAGYFFCSDLLLFYLMRFIFFYIDKERPKFLGNAVIVPAIALDLALLVTNNFHQLMYDVYPTTLFDNLDFYRFTPNLLFIYHGVVIYGMALVSIIALINKSKQTSGIYRVKNDVMLILIVVCLALNTYSLYFKWGFDVSVVIYVIAGLLFYFFTLIYVPKQLKKSIVNLVADQIEYGLTVFDVDFVCEYSNSKAIDYFDIKEGDVIKSDHRLFDIMEVDMETLTKSFRRKKDEDSEVERSVKKLVRITNGKVIRLKVVYKILYNNLGYRIGSYVIARDISAEHEAMLLERYKSTHDELTGIYNKDYFYQRCEETLAANPDTDYFMVSSDVLNFKLVNDLFGHDKGDELLCRIADKMREICGDYTVYGRIGADKFALLIPKDKFYRDDYISYPKSVAYVDAEIYYPLTIYVGVYDIVDRNMPIHLMYDRASMAMDSIKGDYQQRVANYSEDMREKAMQDQQMLQSFEAALRNSDIKIYLQPQVDSEGKVIGAEALARWVDPKKGVIPPMDFIPLLEKNGMIGRLDVYVWKLACSKLAEWEKRGIDLSISVNISPKDFYYMDISKIFKNYLKLYDISPSKLHLEITETAVFNNVPKQVSLIEELQNLDYVVEMDDFGSGFSSLNMLKDIPVDVVKIDMAFLQKTENVDKARIILSSIISLCKKLDIATVVEGVETSAQLEFLVKEGADMFQGYFFSKPIPVEEFEESYCGGHTVDFSYEL